MSNEELVSDFQYKAAAATPCELGKSHVDSEQWIEFNSKARPSNNTAEDAEKMSLVSADVGVSDLHEIEEGLDEETLQSEDNSQCTSEIHKL